MRLEAIFAVFVLITAPGIGHTTDNQPNGHEATERSWLEIKRGRLQWLESVTQLPVKGFIVQLGVFSDESGIEKYVSDKKLQNLHLFSIPSIKDGITYQLLFYGPLRFEDNARRLGSAIQERFGIDTFVRPISSLSPKRN